jgi:hypothetical protein
MNLATEICNPPKILTTNTTKPSLLSATLLLFIIIDDGNILFPICAFVVIGIKIVPCMGYGLTSLGSPRVQAKKGRSFLKETIKNTSSFVSLKWIKSRVYSTASHITLNGITFLLSISTNFIA